MVLTVLVIVAGVLAQPAQAAGRDDRGGTSRCVSRPTTSRSTGTRRASSSRPEHRHNAQARTVAEMIQRAAPTSCCSTSSTTSRATARPTSSGELPRRSQQGAPPRRVPVRVRRAVEHRHPERLRPQQRHGHRSAGGDDAFGFGAFEGQFGMAVLSSTRSPPTRAHVPALPLEGHARRAAARRPGHRGARRLVLPRGARGVPPVEQVALGRPRAGRRHTVHVLASHPTPPTFDGAEDRNGTPQPRRDPLLGRLRPARRAGRYIYDDAGRRGGLRPGSLLRHPRRPERRPARR